MATYSRAKLLARAIESILQQTFRDFELIIVDDGSKDETKKVIEHYALLDNRIRWLFFDENSGTPALRYNQGMALARGEYIAFMFDDDEWYPHALDTLYTFFGFNLECGMIYGLADYLDVRDNSYIGKNFGENWDYKKLVEEGNFICNNSVLIKRSVIDAVGGYDEAPVLKRLCDWDLWVRIGAKFPVKRIPISVGRVNAFHSDSIGVNIPLNIVDIRKHQSSNRHIPLKNYWKNKKVIAFVTHGHDAALKRWRVDYLADAINDLNCGWEAIKLDKKTDNFEKLDIADVIVLYRYLLGDNEIERLIGLGKFVIYDLDDDVTEDNPKYNKTANRRFALHWLKNAKAITVATNFLKNAIPHHEKCYVRKNAVPFEKFPDVAVKSKNKKVIHLGWLAGVNRIESTDFVLKLLKKLCLKKKIRFTYFGKTEEFYNSLNKIPHLVVDRKPYVPFEDPQDFYKTIEQANLDCVINPLPNENFFECKSELKFIETGLLGIPLVTSPRGVFKDIAEKDTNCLLAESLHEFEEKVFKSLDRKKEIARNAKNFLKINNNICHERDQYLTLLNTLLLKPAFFLQDNFIPGRMVPESTTVLGEIFGQKTILQTFISDYDNLFKIQIKMGTYMRNNSGLVEISLISDLNDMGSVLKSTRIDCRKIVDNAYIDFIFDPIRDSAKKKYGLIIKSLNCRSGSAVTVYYNPRHLNGNLYVNKSKFNGCLCFQTSYLKRI